MHSDTVILDQIMFKLLTLNKHRLQSLLLRVSLHRLNITKSIKFYSNCSAPAATNFSESTMSNSSKPVENAHLQKLAN